MNYYFFFNRQSETLLVGEMKKAFRVLHYPVVHVSDLVLVEKDGKLKPTSFSLPNKSSLLEIQIYEINKKNLSQ